MNSNPLLAYKKWLREEIRVFEQMSKDKRHPEAFRSRVIQSLSTLLRCQEVLESKMTDADYELFKDRK